MKTLLVINLVDYFDDETAREILISEGLSERDASHVVGWIGGVPLAESVIMGRQVGILEELYLWV